MQSLTVKGIAIWSRQGGTLPGDDAMRAKTIRADDESRALVHLNKNDREKFCTKGYGVCVHAVCVWGGVPKSS